MKTSDGGEFIRQASSFRHWVTPDGAPGPSGEGGFPAEPGRYHLYVSYACPWAHRTLIVRALKDLEPVIPISVVHPLMPPESWVFGEYPGATPDRVHGFQALHQLYAQAAPGFSGLVTVPVLYDTHRQVIVNNESSEIIRMLNGAFNAWGRRGLDLYPEPLRPQIDAINAIVYENVNNGVYRAGFATSQSAYEAAYDRLFETLDDLERRLARQRYLVGDRLTEADWRLFTTLVRFDAVYYGHFKCNRRRLIDYPSLWAYTRELYQMPGIAATVRMDHIKLHYYGSHRGINPTGIVPKGPALDFAAPHGRESIGLGAVGS
ncbi:MAG: glutathione S-transferase family protein [Bdellovibrio bacteriovorus]